MCRDYFEQVWATSRHAATCEKLVEVTKFIAVPVVSFGNVQVLGGRIILFFFVYHIVFSYELSVGSTKFDLAEV